MNARSLMEVILLCKVLKITFCVQEGANLNVFAVYSKTQHR